MASNAKPFQTTATSIFVHSIFGLAILVFYYGVLGVFRAALRYVTMGYDRFFHRVSRPAPPSKALDPIYGTHHMMKLKSSGMTLHYVSKGLPNQPMILFLHGFPECWYSWRHQMKFFSKEYRVVAIDQRGYGLSSKPPYIADYRLEVLAGDVADIIEQLGYESSVIVGHDLGGSVAWLTAMLYPHLVEKLVVINSPHPMAFRHNLSLEQMRRSWELFFNQMPFLPELVLSANDFSKIEESFRKKPFGLVNRDQLIDEDLQVYKYTFSQKGTAKAAINYFRALIHHTVDYTDGGVSAPVLLLWAKNDPLYDESMADITGKYCPDIRVTKINSSSRWANQDVPDTVNSYIDLFLKENAPMEHSYDF